MLSQTRHLAFCESSHWMKYYSMTLSALFYFYFIETWKPRKTHQSRIYVAGAVVPEQATTEPMQIPQNRGTMSSRRSDCFLRVPAMALPSNCTEASEVLTMKERQHLSYDDQRYQRNARKSIRLLRKRKLPKSMTWMRTLMRITRLKQCKRKASHRSFWQNVCIQDRRRQAGKIQWIQVPLKRNFLHISL